MINQPPPNVVYIAMELERGEHANMNVQTNVDKFKFDNEPVRIVYEYKLVRTRQVRRVLHMS